MFRIGIDVGGTFTDFVVLNEQTSEVSFYKCPSTPIDPSLAIYAGLKELIQSGVVVADAISFLGHGSTVATNMVIERRGSTTGLLTTKGFRDVIEIGRQSRPHLYDYSIRKPDPLVPRVRRMEIDERVSAAAETLVPISEEDVVAAANALAAQGVASVAICFLHSYANSKHEERAAEIVRSILPDAYVSISSDILPEFREYERLSTTVMNYYVGPRMELYLERLLAHTKELGIPIQPHTVQSNGGLMSVESVKRYPVRTCLSGPAAGVTGAAVIANWIGALNIITFDVGGTSTDVSLVHAGLPNLTGSRTVADYPVKTQMTDIHVIGAGGGSIAWIDDAGALKVGPQSAGADPGPAAYGRGGVEPTITDANILLGRLDPSALLGGRMQIDREAAIAAIDKGVASKLKMTPEAAAYGMLRIANANMSRAIRSVSIERGYDLAGFALFAFGGAGGLHAAEVADQCGINQIIVPVEPGTMCARGVLLTDVRRDFVRSEMFIIQPNTWDRVSGLFRQIAEQGDQWLENENVGKKDRRFTFEVEARYVGQNFEINVSIDDQTTFEEFARRFAERHKREYGYDIPGRDIESVNCRVFAIGTVPKAPPSLSQSRGTLSAALVEERPIYFGDGGWCPSPVYKREELPLGESFAGPAVVQEMSATTIVLPSQTARIDEVGNIIIERRR